MTTTTSEPGRWAKINHVLILSMKIGRWLLLVVLIVALVVAGYLLYTILAFGWPIKSGFDEFVPPQPKPEGYEREKTLWDWMQLLVIPFVLAIAAFFLNRTERINAERAAEQRVKTERELAEQRAQDAALQAYLDQMTELLLHEKLRTSQPDDEVRSVARARTLTVLPGLGLLGKATVLQFLYEAKLIGRIKQEEGGVSGTIDAIVRLDGANLSEAWLRGAHLDGAPLEWARLDGAHLDGARLDGANLERAHLDGAHLEETFLVGAHLEEAFLDRVNLKRANLKGAFLDGANLERAFLDGADLTNCEVTREQLAQAKSLEGATLPFDMAPPAPEAELSAPKDQVTTKLPK